MEQLGIDRGELVPKKKRPNLSFEEGSYTLPELLESHLLPVVAQYDVSRQPIPFHEFNFDLSQPLLLYKKRHIQKVAAHSLYIEDDKYHEIGESILIPEDYKGWFAVLQRLTGNCKADDAVPHFATVEELANSNTDRFLIGGTNKITGIQLLEPSDSTQQKHEQRHFMPGDILTRDKIFYGETKKRSRLFRKPKYITEKFLMCRDELDREILLPFEQTGIFYQVSHKFGKANKNVMQMSDIVARKLTPRIIKLVFGRFPVNTPCSFTGLMRAESSDIETSIIAATMINTKNILMEIPVSSAIYFRVANMDSDLRKNECHRNAMSLCAERAITYMRNIKVCYNFTMDDSSESVDRFLESGTFAATSNGGNVNNNNEEHTKAADTESFEETREIGTHGILRTQLQKSYFKALSAPRVFSVDIPDEVSMRPARCLSAGRMSFCLGNNYLTVPLLEPSIYNRNSGNNNTINEISCKTRRGSRISFNGTFFEEESGDELDNDVTADDSDTIEMPPAIPCTTIGSYVNVVSPTTPMRDPIFTEYISPTNRRPSTQPPDSAPPPLPRSSSTSGVSSGSMSPSRDSNNSNRGSDDSFEYAVPKIQDSNSSTPENTITRSHDRTESQRVSRRPSTFQFSEGCFAGPKSSSKRPACATIADEDAEESPIYENIQTLMELVSKMDETNIRHSDIDSDIPEEADENEEDADDDDADVIADDGGGDYGDDDDDDFTKGVTRETEKDGQSEEPGENKHLNIYIEDQPGNDSRRLNDEVSGQDLSDVVSDLNICKSDDTDMKSAVDASVVDADNLSELNEIEEKMNFSCEVVASLCIDSNDSQLGHCDLDVSASDNKTRTRRIGVTSMEKSCDSPPLTTLDCSSSKSQISENNTLVNDAPNVTDYVETMTKPDNELSENCNRACADMSDPQSLSSGNEATTEITSANNNAPNKSIQSNNHSVDKKPDEEQSDELNVDCSLEHTVEVSAELSPDIESQYQWKQAVEKAKHSDEVLLSRAKIRTLQKPFHSLTVDEIAEALVCIGIKDGTVGHIKALKVDGARLTEVLEGELSIRDCLCGVNLVDQQKISMFIRGWRPNSTD